MKDTLFIMGTSEFVKKFSLKTTLSHTVYYDGNHQMFVFGKQSKKKCKPRTGKHLQDWEDVCKLFPKLSIKWDYTKAHITMDSMPASYTFIVVARPKPTDRKRMLFVAFLKQSEIEENLYVVHVYLYDDIKVLFENFCKVKEETGYMKLAPEKQFFLCYDPEKDVQISLTNLDNGWRLEDTDVKTIEFERYWETYKSKASCSFKLRPCSEQDSVSFNLNARHCSTQLSLSKDIEVSCLLRQTRFPASNEIEKKRKMDYVVRCIKADDEILDLVFRSLQGSIRDHRLIPTAKSKKKSSIKVVEKVESTDHQV